MCKYSYSQFNEKAKTEMLYCLNKDNKRITNGLCLCQRYCRDKQRYIPHNQDKKHCKYCADD